MSEYVIDGLFLTQRITGTQRYAYEIVGELDKLVEKNRLQILVPVWADKLPEYQNIEVVKYGKAVEKVHVLVVSSLLVTIINCGLNLFLLLYMKTGVNGYLIASIISSLCGLLYSLIKGKVFSTLKIKFDSKLFKQMLIFSIPAL